MDAPKEISGETKDQTAQYKRNELLQYIAINFGPEVVLEQIERFDHEDREDSLATPDHN